MTNALKKKRPFWLLLLFLFPFYAFSQTMSVSGVITDETGEGLPGVSVTEPGTTNGTMSDISGKYQINVSSNSKLSFSFLGFQTIITDVKGQNVINIVMKEDSEILEEVVVVGYGQMRRSDLTGSVVSVTNDAIEKSISTSIDQVLQGRAAGVQVTQNSGMPGGSASIRIRGTNSINSSNEPIFVIDGVIVGSGSSSNTENPLSSINPSDVLSMDILKDASATAIYGSRGANGVIIITTKRGKDGTARITYDGYMGFQQMPEKLDMLNLRQYAQHHNERSKIMGYPQEAAFIRYDLLGKGTDWQDELFGTAMMQSHNLSVSGGNQNIVYAFGAGYLDQEGIVLGSGFDRLTLRGNIDATTKPWLKMGVSFAISQSKQKITVSDDNLIYTALLQTPNVASKNLDGSYGGPETDEFVQSNPVALANLKENENEKFNVRSNIYAEATIIKGLTLKTEFSSDLGSNNTYKFNPSYEFGAIKNEVRESERSKSYNKYWAWRNVLTYNKLIKEKHAITAMLGHEMQESSWEYLYGYRKGFIANGAHDLDAGDATTAKNGNSSGQNSLMSFFGRAFYSFDDRYLLTATLRRDGSSKFAKDNRWGWFPSAAVAWKVSNESFLRDHDVINNLKVRLGWGSVGNENIPDNYAYTAIMSSVSTPWGTGLLSGNTANPELEWETTKAYNLGFDVALFRNRIELIVDLYHKKTDNLLLKQPLPYYVGTWGQGATSEPWVNIGSLQNRGLEITLNTVNIDKKNFSWRSNFVYSMNRNKVKSLDMESSHIMGSIAYGAGTAAITRTRVGHPIGEFYGYKVIGRFEKATDFYYKDNDGNVKQVAIPQGVNISENGVWIGDYIYQDTDGDGEITDDDMVAIGNPEPKFTFGIGNTFTYKDFDLTVYLNGSYGNDVFNQTRRRIDDPRQSHNLSTRALGYARLGLIDPDGGNNFRNIQVVGGDSDMPRLSPSDANTNYRISDRFVEDGSYLRIQNISLGYTVPRKIVQKLSIDNLRIYTNIQNLYTFTKYKGYDPEVGAINQNATLTGIDDARYPSPRIYTFGLNLTF